MAPKTKYQAAPQHDSFDEPSPSYTQAPPSYQAEASQNEPMLGGPREEDDNIPDDFKVSYAEATSKLRMLTLPQFGGSVAEATLPIRMQFVRKVYAIL